MLPKNTCLFIVYPDMSDRERLQVKTSIESTSSESITDFPDQAESWMNTGKAQRFCLQSLTALYALILTIVAFIIEISPTWQSEEMHIEYTIFCIIMYSIALLYFVYLYSVILYPVVFNSILLCLERIRLVKVESVKVLMRPEPVYDGEGAGTLYLRLGVLLFGTLGSVLWGSEIFLCFFTQNRHNVYVAKYILAVVFTYVQMHFLCCNSKITIPSGNLIASFGTMHCIAVNLWVWFSLCLAKAVYKSDKKTMKLEKYKGSNATVAEIVNVAMFRANEKQLRSLYKLGSAANFLLTTLVEFSLIAAAVYFIIWKHRGEQLQKETRKKHFRFDCKSTSVGIFAGLILLIGSFVSIAMHYIYNNSNKARIADEVIGIAETVLFCVSLLAVFAAFIRMRKLQYRLHAHGEVVDEILLIVGVAGEIVYCSTGLDLYVNEKIEGHQTTCLTVVAFVCRIVQVIVQCVFILVASRLRSLSFHNISEQPGKQLITFLVVCNLTLFIYHTFETIESNFGFPHKMSSIYAALLNISSPVVVFYRFHSSACLAEIWKHAYSNKHVHKPIELQLHIA